MIFQIIIFLNAVLLNEILGKDVRILGGENTNAEEYPFMASFRYAIQNIIFCGGAIISNKHILTAAHCLYEKQHEYHKIRIYTGITATLSITGGVHEILHVFYYPEFRGLRTHEGILRHDIAVVEVRQVIQFSECQYLVALPNNDLNNYETGWIMGWGSNTDSVVMLPNQMQRLFIRVLLGSKCWNRISYKIYPEQFCGFLRKGVGPCYGDNGSPLVIANKIVGIISHVHPCAQGIPDIYTKVYSYVDFIRNLIGNQS